MEKCYKMVGSFFSRVTSPRRRDSSPQVVDVIRAVPHNGVPAKEASPTGAYKAGVWVWDAPHARTSPRARRPKHGQSLKTSKDQRKCHSMEVGVGYPELRYQLPCQQEAHSVTPSSMSQLDNDAVKRANLSKRPQSADISSKKMEKYITLPHGTWSSKPRDSQAVSTATTNSRSTDTGSAQNHRTQKEEVKQLARSMVSSIENLIDNLHGIMGDLRQLVDQIDVIAESMDSGCSTDTTSQQNETTVAAVPKPSVKSNTVHTQTDFEQQCYASLGRTKYAEACDRLEKSPTHRYSYPQCCRNSVAIAPPPLGCDADKGRSRRSASSRSGDSPHNIQIVVNPSSPHKQQVPCETRHDSLSRLRRAGPSQFQQRPNTFSVAPLQDSLRPPLVPPHCAHSPEPSMPFMPVESPPNPAPTLFSSFREDPVNPTKDSDTLPNRSLKTWKEKMEQYCGSADSLTPQIDWSYLILTDHHLAATVQELPQSKSANHSLPQSNRSVDSPSSQRDSPRLRLSGYSLDSRRAHRDRTRLSQSGKRVKHHIGAITRIPEHGELHDSSYDEDRDVFADVETCSAVSVPSASASISQAEKEIVDIAQQVLGRLRFDHQDSPNPRSAYQDTNSPGVFSRGQQSVISSNLSQNSHSKALPKWPSEDLSSIAASDCEVDDLSSPFLQHHFQYPRRSSALDSSSEQNIQESGPKLSRASSMSESIASGGFEVRPDLHTSTESEMLATTYASQYENAMESRLEQLTNEVGASDFSDADADVGSDVLEQSLTSLEETSGVKYDRELNTWTSYTMTHIDSDDVVSDCTSDILNENLLEMITTNPGFDDVNLNFDDVGLLPLTLQGSTVEIVSPCVE